MDERVALCAQAGGSCPPLSWTISNRLATFAPYVLQWYYRQAPAHVETASHGTHLLVEAVYVRQRCLAECSMRTTIGNAMRLSMKGLCRMSGVVPSCERRRLPCPLLLTGTALRRLLHKLCNTLAGVAPGVPCLHPCNCIPGICATAAWRG